MSSKWLQKMKEGETGIPYTPFADHCIKTGNFTIHIPELITQSAGKETKIHYFYRG